MQKCTYKEKNIYAFNVIGKNETINYTLEKEWKKASEANQLICDECGAHQSFLDVVKLIYHILLTNQNFKGEILVAIVMKQKNILKERNCYYGI